MFAAWLPNQFCRPKEYSIRGMTAFTGEPIRPFPAILDCRNKRLVRPGDCAADSCECPGRSRIRDWATPFGNAGPGSQSRVRAERRGCLPMERIGECPPTKDPSWVRLRSSIRRDIFLRHLRCAIPTELNPAARTRFRSSGASPMRKLLSGVKLSGPLTNLANLAICQRRNAMPAIGQRHGEFLPIRLQQLEGEFVGNLCPPSKVWTIPGKLRALRHRLRRGNKCTDPGSRPTRQFIERTRERLRHDVMMLHRIKRNGDAAASGRVRASTCHRKNHVFGLNFALSWLARR